LTRHATSTLNPYHSFFSTHPTAAEGEPANRACHYDYIYSSDKPQAVLRCLVSLANVDGVTALRIGLHGLELIEGNASISDPELFAKPPPYTYGWRQRMNFAGMLAGTLGSIAAANIFGCVMNR